MGSEDEDHAGGERFKTYVIFVSLYPRCSQKAPGTVNSILPFAASPRCLYVPGAARQAEGSNVCFTEARLSVNYIRLSFITVFVTVSLTC